jgi:hypothetical protein
LVEAAEVLLPHPPFEVLDLGEELGVDELREEVPHPPELEDSPEAELDELDVWPLLKPPPPPPRARTPTVPARSRMRARNAIRNGNRNFCIKVSFSETMGPD